MAIRNILLSLLDINRANDRHGELENETAAIAWLFNEREAHMRSLAKDIVKQGRIYEIPLISPSADRFIVFDGNRRVTCLKLLSEPRRAPTAELQEFFAEQRAMWTGKFPTAIQCQVESDREQVDEILYRRHTGSQGGVGQSKWDDRMQSTFVSRTGKGGGINVADEVEERLKSSNLLPTRRKIPRSTLNRLLSAEPFRNRVGFSIKGGKFEYTHDASKVLSALSRICDDMVHRRLVLGNIWDVDGKTAYLDKLTQENVLPTPADLISTKIIHKPPGKKPTPKPKPAPQPTAHGKLIPNVDYGLVWPGRLQRHHEIWNELQFHLELKSHPNAISVLFRVLLELSVENYISQCRVPVHPNDSLSNKVLKCATNMCADQKISDKQLGELRKFNNAEKIVSADTLNRYVHSPNFAPSPEHLRALWDGLSFFVVICLLA